MYGQCFDGEIISDYTAIDTGIYCILTSFEPMEIPQTATLQTPRMLLKEMTPEWITAVFSTYDDDMIMTLFGMQTEKELETEKKKVAGGFTTHFISMKNFLMQLKQTGETIGKIGFHTWFPVHSRAEIGYAMASENHKNKGYMSEAMKAVIEYGFEHMQLQRIEACIGPENVPSNKLAAKFGFVKEGLLRKHYCKDGIHVDSFIYSLLKDEYQP